MATTLTNKRAMPPLAIEALRVRSDRVVATVRVGDAACRNTTPRLARLAFAARPNLPIHTCVNGRGPTFGAVASCTPLPHLLEHVVIDLQTLACPDASRVFTGATRWTNLQRGVAQVEVSYADDLVALRAFRDAALQINAWVRQAGLGGGE